MYVSNYFSFDKRKPSGKVEMQTNMKTKLVINAFYVVKIRKNSKTYK